MGREIVLEPQDLQVALQRYLREAAGDERPVQIRGRLSGGWSVDTFRVDVGGEQLVLRVANADHPLQTSPAKEARLFPLAVKAGIPSPRLVHAVDDAKWLGGPFSLSSFVLGEAPNVWSARRMDALVASAGSKQLLSSLADVALRIQSVPVEDGAQEPPSTLGLQPADYRVAADVARWVELLRQATRARAALETAGEWLGANAPATEEVVFQHHDFRLGNVLYAKDGTPQAVLDWEFSGAGDPLCDITYAAQPYSLGRLLRADPRFDLRDPTGWALAAYAERCSSPPEPGRVGYFVAFGIFKMAVALALTAEEWWSGRGVRRDAWLELPILSLSRDLVQQIRKLP